MPRILRIKQGVPQTGQAGWNQDRQDKPPDGGRQDGKDSGRLDKRWWDTYQSSINTIYLKIIFFTQFCNFYWKPASNSLYAKIMECRRNNLWRW